MSNTQEGPKDTVSNTRMQIGLRESVSNMHMLPTDSMSNTLDRPKDKRSNTLVRNKYNVFIFTLTRIGEYAQYAGVNYR